MSEIQISPEPLRREQKAILFPSGEMAGAQSPRLEEAIRAGDAFLRPERPMGMPQILELVGNQEKTKEVRRFLAGGEKTG